MCNVLTRWMIQGGRRRPGHVVHVARVCGRPKPSTWVARGVCVVAMSVLVSPACQRQPNKPAGSRPAAIDQAACVELRKLYLAAVSSENHKERSMLFLHKVAALGDRAVPCVQGLIEDEGLPVGSKSIAVFSLVRVNTSNSVDYLVHLMSVESSFDQYGFPHADAARALEMMVRQRLRSAAEFKVWPGLLDGATEMLESDHKLDFGEFAAAADLIVRVEGLNSELVRRFQADRRPEVRKAIEEAITAYVEDLARSATKPAVTTKPGVSCGVEKEDRKL
jgi:hypothetical protein